MNKHDRMVFFIGTSLSGKSHHAKDEELLDPEDDPIWGLQEKSLKGRSRHEAYQAAIRRTVERAVIEDSAIGLHPGSSNLGTAIQATMHHCMEPVLIGVVPKVERLYIRAKNANPEGVRRRLEVARTGFEWMEAAQALGLFDMLVPSIGGHAIDIQPNHESRLSYLRIVASNLLLIGD